MCRLAMKTASEPFSPFSVLQAMEAMQEGYDGSGLGLLLRGLTFADYKYNAEDPILSGIAHSEEALARLDHIMDKAGFTLKYDHEFDVNKAMIEAQDRHKYVLRVYKKPAAWSKLTAQQVEHELMLTRLALRADGEANGNDLTAFSLWPDVVMIKEVGWPLGIGLALGLDSDRITSRICMAQGRQNTNYGINLYACHPFFIQGIATMTNGENTAFVPIREFLMSRREPGYVGYQSDSEVFTHILHYSLKHLNLDLETYKHILTPLKDDELDRHPNGPWLRMLKQSCRPLIIDGPNCVMGCLPDKTLFMLQDSKKLRPGVVGGNPGMFAFSSEMCGLDAAIPARDKSKDFQPMKYDTVFVGPERQEVRQWSQMDSLSRLH